MGNTDRGSDKDTDSGRDNRVADSTVVGMVRALEQQSRQVAVVGL